MRSRAGVAAVLILLACVCLAPAALASEGAEAEHANPAIGLVAKVLNFAILAGTLVYFLRSPFAKYLSDRSAQIRSDLVKAADMKVSAAAQLAAIDEKMAALPAELDALRRTGAAEVAQEEARIREAADKERERLLAQMAREIDLRTRAAERDLVKRASGRAIDAAAAYIRATMTEADQTRLVDRYVSQIGPGRP